MPEPIHPHLEQMHLFPVGQLVEALGGERRDGRELCTLDAGAPPLGVVAVGETALAAWVEGRTAGSTVLPLPDGRFASWAADKTVRLWT